MRDSRQPIFTSPGIPLEHGNFEVDVLLPIPKGIFVTIQCKKNTTLREVKDKVWRKLENLGGELGDKNKFCFEGISQTAIMEKYGDCELTFAELQLYCPTLKLVETRVVDTDKKFIADLSMLVGRNVIMDTHKSNSREISDYQELMEYTSINFEKIQAQRGWRELLRQKHPLSVDLNLHGSVLEHEREYNTLQYHIWYDTSYGLANTGPGKKFKINSFFALFQTKVSTLITSVVEIEKLAPSKEYILQVSGKEHFLLDDTLILPHYKYIQQCIRDSVIPELVLVRYSELLPAANNTNNTNNTNVLHDNIFTISPLHCNVTTPGTKVVCNLKEKMSLTIKFLRGLDPDRDYKMRVFVGLYCGTEQVEQVQTTEKIMTSVVEWNEILTFDIDMADLPRSSKICISIQKRADSKKKNAETFKATPLYWMNLSVFDHKGFLRQGKLEEHLWPENLVREFHSSGTLTPYDLTDTPTLCVAFKERKSPVRFYDMVEAKELAMKAIRENQADNLQEAESRVLEPEERTKLEDILSHWYGTYELKEEDKEMLWKYRVHCCQHYPQSLPTLLKCIKWKDLSHCLQIYTLLIDWKPITLATALQLLHMEVADPHIREFAVHAVDKLVTDDEELQLYLLQLVEVLKHEMYIDSALSRFLIKRSLYNCVLGHYFYWHLRSQVEGKQHGVQYGLILECYLRCCVSHTDELKAMTDAMFKISSTFDKCTTARDPASEMRVVLNSPNVNKALSGFACIFNPRLRTGEVIVAKTRIFNSKMKPMKLTFTNRDTTSSTYKEFSMMYKRGDDLRQDQLVYQFIRLMDKIWLDEDIDLKIQGYQIIATSYKAGIIEFVQKTNTLSNLIIEYRTFGALKLFLKEKHPNPRDYEEARYKFTQSCCGNTLIQFILGISDRHPSNILITEEGRMVHIDFGHILGNKKQKFGINREPAPFIFMEDFVDLISNGKGVNSDEFKEFEQQFLKAYLILRRYAEEFLTLLHLMITAGLSELSCTSHIECFTRAMCVGKTEDEAERFILALLHESIKKTRAVQSSWFFHLVRIYP